MKATPGRVLFNKNKKIIVSLIRFIPKPILIFAGRMLKNSDGKVALLARYLMHRKTMQKCGDSAYFGSMLTIKNPELISIGDNFSAHEYCYIDGAGSIEVGDCVSIAHNCSLVSFEHTWDDIDIQIKYNPIKTAPIKIGNDVWLGCGVRVLAGSIIENRVVVAAGAVVKGKLESGFLYAGVPAKKIKPLSAPQEFANKNIEKNKHVRLSDFA